MKGADMSEEKCSYNWEAECQKLREKMTYREEEHIAKENELRREIEKLKNELMIYEQKWSVIQLIFGK